MSQAEWASQQAEPPHEQEPRRRRRPQANGSSARHSDGRGESSAEGAGSSAASAPPGALNTDNLSPTILRELMDLGKAYVADFKTQNPSGQRDPREVRGALSPTMIQRLTDVGRSYFADPPKAPAANGQAANGRGR